MAESFKINLSDINKKKDNKKKNAYAKKEFHKLMLNNSIYCLGRQGGKNKILFEQKDSKLIPEIFSAETEEGKLLCNTHVWQKFQSIETLLK